MCGENLDLELKVALFDYERDGEHVFMGELTTSVNELIKAKSSELTLPMKIFKLIKNGFKVKSGELQLFKNGDPTGDPTGDLVPTGDPTGEIIVLFCASGASGSPPGEMVYCCC